MHNFSEMQWYFKCMCVCLLFIFNAILNRTFIQDLYIVWVLYSQKALLLAGLWKWIVDEACIYMLVSVRSGIVVTSYAYNPNYIFLDIDFLNALAIAL